MCLEPVPGGDGLCRYVQMAGGPRAQERGLGWIHLSLEIRIFQMKITVWPRATTPLL